MIGNRAQLQNRNQNCWNGIILLLTIVFSAAGHSLLLEVKKYIDGCRRKEVKKLTNFWNCFEINRVKVEQHTTRICLSRKRSDLFSAFCFVYSWNSNCISLTLFLSFFFVSFRLFSFFFLFLSCPFSLHKQLAWQLRRTFFPSLLSRCNFHFHFSPSLRISADDFVVSAKKRNARARSSLPTLAFFGIGCGALFEDSPTRHPAEIPPGECSFWTGNVFCPTST